MNGRIDKQTAREIVDWVMKEIRRQSFSYVTDGKIDFNKITIGTISGGGECEGGQIDNETIWNRHIHPNADIRGTKIRVATTTERGAVELAEHLESSAGLALQSDDPRLHDTVPSGSAEHDTRYYTESELDAGQLDNRYYTEIELDGGQLDNRYRTETELQSTAIGQGASLIGVHDVAGAFAGTDVEAVLYELFAALGAMTFIALIDTPNGYVGQAGKNVVVKTSENGLEFNIPTFLRLVDTPNNYWNKFPQVPTVNESEASLEWRPVDYYDGGDIAENYSGAVDIRRGEKMADCESATMNNTLDGGLATDPNNETFLALLDVPNSYVGHSHKVIRVSSSENGLEFVVSSGVSGVDSINSLIGAVTLSGVGSVGITEQGQVIVISGAVGGGGGITEETALTHAMICSN